MDAVWWRAFISLTEVESEVVDKLKYIEETKETMEQNTKKLAEIVQDIKEIHAGMIMVFWVQEKFMKTIFFSSASNILN